MGVRWPTRSFKSGNSVAVRVPAALGVEPNRDWTIEERDGELVLRKADAPRRKIDVSKIAGIGKHLGLRYLTPEERDFEHRPLLWDDDYVPPE